MSFSRRDLFKYLGFGGASLITTGPEAIAKLVGEEVKHAVEDYYESEWRHPDQDAIESFLKMGMGYPNTVGGFTAGGVCVCKGDELNINYDIVRDMGLRNSAILWVFGVVSTCRVFGMSLQGPVVEDRHSKLGHRLATSKELVLNKGQTQEYYDKLKA